MHWLKHHSKYSYPDMCDNQMANQLQLTQTQNFQNPYAYENTDHTFNRK